MDKKQFLLDLSAMSGIPLFWRSEEESICTKTQDNHYRFLAETISSVLHSGENGCVQLTDGIFLGVLWRDDGNELLMAGPVAGNRCDIEQAKDILHFAGHPISEIYRVLAYFSNISPCSANKLARLLCVLADVYLEKKVLYSEVLPKLGELPSDNENRVRHEERRSAYRHDTAEYERTMYSLIRYGNSSGLERFLEENAFYGNEGHPGLKVMRHYKNAVIASIAIASHSANEGGLAYETAMNLADDYYEETELAKTVSELYKIHREMLLTYAVLVEKLAVNHSESLLITKVRNFVQKHLGENLKNESIADELHVSRSYLSHAFSKETGISLKEYINRMKVTEARRILAVTDRSVQDIAISLGFCSQSHFAYVFNKYAGCSPSEYRKEKYYSKTVRFPGETGMRQTFLR